MKLLEKVQEFEDKKFYNNIIEEYYKFISINTDKGPFIGSQPTQILPKDIPHLLKNTIITPKIDGKRYLCVFKKNAIGFVTRSMDFSYPVHISKKFHILEKTKVIKRENEKIEYLINKEIFNKKEKIRKINENTRKKIFSFLKSDIESYFKVPKNDNKIKIKLIKKIKDIKSRGTKITKNDINEIDKLKNKLIIFDEKIEKDQKNKQIEKEQIKKNKKIVKKIISESNKKIKKIQEKSDFKIKQLQEIKKKSSDGKYIYKLKNNKIVKDEKFAVIKQSQKFIIPDFDFKSENVYLFDCEVVEKNGFLQIFLFDIIMINKNNEIQKIYENTFFRRMDYLYSIYNDLIVNVNKKFGSLNIPIKFYFKGFFTFDIFDKKINYNSLLKMYNKKMNLKKYEEPEYDGVIFVNTLYKYYLGPGFARGQYKWKPENKLTIDLKIVKENGKWKALGKHDKNVDGSLDIKKLKNEYNNKVYEFLYINKKFILHEPVIDRTDKGANAYATIKNTIEAGDKFFSLSDFGKMVKYMSGKENMDKNVIKWLDKDTAIKICSLCCNKNFIKNKTTFEKNFKKFLKIDPRIKKITEKQKNELQMDRTELDASITKLVEYINENLYKNDEDDFINLIVFIDKNNLLYSTTYEKFMKNIYKQFPTYKKPDEKIQKDVNTMINKINAIQNIVDFNSFKPVKKDLLNYNKFIRISFNKKLSSKLEKASKGDDFYKLISRFKYLTNSPYYKGISNITKKLGDYELTFNNYISNKNLNSITKEKIENFSTIDLYEDLGYNVKIDMGYLEYHKKEKLKSLNIGNINNYTIKNVYVFSVPNFPWIINLVEKINHKPIERKYKYEKSLIKEKEKRNKQISNTNSSKTYSWDIEAVLVLKKGNTNSVENINLVINKFFKYLIF